MSLPPGCRPEEAAAELAGFRDADSPVHGGRVLAYVYDAGVPGLGEATAAALASFGELNALDPTVFPSVRHIENHLVGWGLDLLGGGPDSCGVVTSGGTESCIMAVLAAREAWRAGGGTGSPSIILPTTGHPAFVKGAHLLDMRVVSVDVDPVSARVHTDDVVAALDAEGDQAALVIVSAPSYPTGVVDPVAEVAAVAAARGVPVHSDCCIGGLVLPYLVRAGRALPDFNLSVPGVRSLSVDLHKYGYAPKGSSLLLFSDTAYRLGTSFGYSSWPGYPVVNTTLQSTKSAGPMAAAWTALRILGDDGLAAAVERAITATDRIVAAVEAIEGLRVVGHPDSTLVAIAGQPSGDGPGIDPFVLSDRMRVRNWFIQPQPAFAGLPRTAHLTVQPASLATVDEFIGALIESADECRDGEWARPDPALAQAAASLDPDTLDEATVAGLLQFAGLTGEGDGRLPEAAAPLHALIEALPPALRDRLLRGFFAGLFTATR